MRLSSIRHELAVGWFILIACLVSGVGLVLRPRTKSLIAGHTLKFTLAHGQGLQEGSPVFVQGIPVGEIDAVELTSENKVVVTCHIHDEFAPNIRRDAHVTVIPPPLLGTTRVEISPGTAPEPAKPGAELSVVKQPSFLEKLDRVEERADSVIARVDSFVLTAMGTLDRFRDMVDRVDRGKGLAGQLIHDPAMAEDVKETLASVRKASERIQGEGIDESLATLKKAQSAIDSVQAEDGRVQTLLAELNLAVKDLRAAVRDAKVGETAATLRTTADTFGKAADELSAQARPLTKEARQALNALLEASRAMRKLSDELARQPDSVIWGRRREAGPGVRRP